jgi:drug/metabolite transporter (DMT)-like permease
MWFLLALGTAVFFATQSAFAKRAGTRFHPDVVAWAAFLYSIPVYAVFFATQGMPEVQPAFWLWMPLSLVTNLVAMPLFFRALHEGELSVVLPLNMLTPLFALLTEYLFLGDVPSPLAFAGIALIVMGAYLLHAGSIRQGVLTPFKLLLKDKGARLMMGATAIWSISAVADRGAVLASSAAFYTIVFAPIFTLVFLPWLLWRRRAELRRSLARPLSLVPVGVFGALMAICQMSALKLALATMVISVKRLAGLFGVLLGGIFFKEKGVGVRLVAAGIMVGGTVLLAFS